ncbi:uncharacterized protein LOC142775481 isoform X2 [Rhipicephalus microplus]|uniref:uncharacterized protein LOC142775481 isoform X2 n=1 Tax=Rhipicephalus microplus TaxID=6941 RepID=UPI003F6B3C1F
MRPSVLPSMCPSARPCMRLLVRPSLRSSMQPPLRPFMRPSMHLSMCPFVHLFNPPSTTISHLFIIYSPYRSTAIQRTFQGLREVAHAHFLTACASGPLSTFNHLEFMVTTTHSQTIAAIGVFDQLTDLSLMFIAQGTLCSFQGPVEDTLKNLPLKHLSLKFFKDVSLAAVAKHWPSLETLSLPECSVIENDADDLIPGSFAGLVNLRLGAGIAIPTFKSLLGATRRLISLCLDADLLVTSFVSHCSHGSLPRLERLVLRTEHTLKVLCLTVKALQFLVEALPALRYVVTDSYDLRLFFENIMPHVTLDWTQCTTCPAEFPRIDETQREFWQKAMTPIKGGK